MWPNSKSFNQVKFQNVVGNLSRTMKAVIAAKKDTALEYGSSHTYMGIMFRYVHIVLAIWCINEKSNFNSNCITAKLLEKNFWKSYLNLDKNVNYLQL